MVKELAVLAVSQSMCFNHPQNHRISTKEMAPFLAVSRKQLFLRYDSAESPAEGTPKHDREWVIEPKNMRSPFENDISNPLVVAIDHPRFTCRGLHDQLAEVFLWTLSPIRPPVQLIQLHVKYSLDISQTVSEGCFAGTTRTNHRCAHELNNIMI